MAQPNGKLKVLIAGGGTGGHVIPALAIARELQSRHNAEVIFAGTSRGIETRLVPAAGYQLKLIEVGQFNRVSLATRLKTLFSLPLSVLKARAMLRECKPGVVLGVGGYASGPAMLGALLSGIPTMVFEPNTVPGMVNRKVARWTKIAAVHFAETGKWFPKFEVTGVPVRQEFFAIQPKSPGSTPTLLVFGGSQGARAINNVMVETAAKLKAAMPSLRVIHQTGPRQFDEIAAAYKAKGLDVEVSAFIDKMAQRFAEADLIVCRSGASTVAEVAAAGKPAIFIPLPTAADDHQRKNAETLVHGDAGLMIAEPELTPEKLASAVLEGFRDPQAMLRVGEAARRLAHKDAASRIADLAAGLARH